MEIATYVALDELDGFDGLAPYLWIAKNFGLYLHAPDALEKRRMGDYAGSDYAGIYFLWDVNGSLLYVGLSHGIGARLTQHTRAGEIPAWAFSCFPIHGVERRSLFLKAIESAYIHALEPAFNVKRQRVHGALMAPLEAAVQKTWAPILAWKHPEIVYVIAPSR